MLHRLRQWLKNHRSTWRLRKLTRQLARSNAMKMPLEAARARLVIEQAFAAGRPKLTSDLRDALDTLAGQLGLAVVDWADHQDDADEMEAFEIDGEALVNARCCAQRGQIDDCLHHLGRALPEDFTIIAERLAAHLRNPS